MLKIRKILLRIGQKAAAAGTGAASFCRSAATLFRAAMKKVRPFAARISAILRTAAVSFCRSAAALFRAAVKKARLLAARITSGAAKTEKFIRRHRISTAVVSFCLITSMLLSVITVTIRRVDIFEDGAQIDSFYAILTDEESILSKAGLTLADGDEFEMSGESGVITVQIARAFPVSITADGATVTVNLASGTVADALEKAGLTCGEEDILSHPATDPLSSGMQITLDRVTGGQVSETVAVDYDTVKKETEELYVGETKVAQEGEEGEKVLAYSVTYINGEESDRELISSEVTKEPVDEIILVGTKVRSTFKKTSSAPSSYKKVISMTATAYSAGGTTATGLPAQWGVVAVDPKVIPLGTKVYVETPDGKYIYGTAIAADTGGAIKGYKIDICVNTRTEAYAFGRRTVNVYIL